MIKKILLLFSFLLFISCFSFAQDELTITTYYPSPYGSYNELQLVAHADPVTSCTDQTKGTMYLDSDDNLIYICQGLSEGWQPLSGYWAPTTADPNNIYNTNTGNVGIGTDNPQAALDIAGGVRVGADNNNCDNNNRGTLRYNTSIVPNVLQYCGPSGWISLGGGGGIGRYLGQCDTGNRSRSSGADGTYSCSGKPAGTRYMFINYFNVYNDRYTIGSNLAPGQVRAYIDNQGTSNVMGYLYLDSHSGATTEIKGRVIFDCFGD